MRSGDRYAGYTIRFVDGRQLGKEYAALHHLTRRGRELGIPEDEIWIAKDLERFANILALHEAIENHLRHAGVNYTDSHYEAERTTYAMYGGTPLYNEARSYLDEDVPDDTKR